MLICLSCWILKENLINEFKLLQGLLFKVFLFLQKKNKKLIQSWFSSNSLRPFWQVHKKNI